MPTASSGGSPVVVMSCHSQTIPQVGIKVIHIFKGMKLQKILLQQKNMKKTQKNGKKKIESNGKKKN